MQTLTPIETHDLTSEQLADVQLIADLFGTVNAGVRFEPEAMQSIHATLGRIHGAITARDGA
jgi:hypothetical protein